MMIGTVKWYDKEKGYGFILANQEDCFVHAKQIHYGEVLTSGDTVEFRLAKSPKGPVAKDVKKL